tara:strand:- start:393 stop:539 length:147 start_codon:yes stop_codon:yes gene_type:complete
MSEAQLEEKIKNLSAEVKKLGDESNWFIVGMKEELKNLQRKLLKKQNK